MSVGAELSFLKVLPLGFLRTNIWLGMQQSASLKRAIARTDSTWKIERDDRQSLLYKFNTIAGGYIFFLDLAIFSTRAYVDKFLHR